MVASTRAVPILMYHSVDNDGALAFQKFVVTPEDFEAQLMHLVDEGYVGLTVSQFAQYRSGAAQLPKKAVLLTFDDGFADFYTHALPLLKCYGFPATLYIATAYVGGTSRWLEDAGEGGRPMLNWEQLREIAAEGVEIGAHTHTHQPLDTIPFEQAKDEIRRSKELLETALAQPVESFCYPYGYYSHQVKDCVRRMGFRNACAVRYEASSLGDDPFALARLIVPRGISREAFARLAAGQVSPLSVQLRQLRTQTWKLVRRLRYHYQNRTL